MTYLLFCAGNHIEIMSEEEVSQIEISHEELIGSTFMVDNGDGEIKYAYIVRLDEDGTAELGDVAYNIETEAGTMGLSYYANPPNVRLDDEQASAVANLLEFHNQQLQTPITTSSSGSNSSSEIFVRLSSLPCVLFYFLAF